MGTIRQESLLIFRLGSIGDTVVALPCFHAIARHYPNHRRVLLTNSLTSVRASSAESVLDGTGLVDEVIYYPVGDFSLRQVMALRREIRRLRPTILIYLAERPTALPVFRDLAFFKAAGIRTIIGAPWHKGLRRCAIDPATLELEYEVHRLARVLEPTISVSLTAPNWDLRLSTDEHAKAGAALAPLGTSPSFLAFAPGAKIAAKDWGSANWADLLELLAAIHDEVAPVMVGASDERVLCERIVKHWPGPAVNLCGQLTPRETAAVLGRCTLLVCHDSGPMHLAASQGTRCIALFGNYNQPRKWYPSGEGHIVIRESRGVREIPVNQVAQAIRRALGTAVIPLQRQIAAN